MALPAPQTRTARMLAERTDPNRLRWHLGVVVSIQTGPPKSLTCTVDVDPSYAGATQVAGIRYLSSYVPTVSDTVVLLGWQSQFVALGKLA